MSEGGPERPDGPPQHIQRIGRALNNTVTRAPWLWPVLKLPMRRFFDRAAGDWDTRRKDSTAHLTALAASFLHLPSTPERVLDLGTGTGEAALLAAREFPRASVRGIDISEEMIAIAKRKVGLDPEGRVAFKVADASRIPWPDDSFDLIIQLNMPPFFGEVARVLRPGGAVAVAASWGEETPFYTPGPVLGRGFERVGITEHAEGATEPGTWWVGRAEA